MFLTTKHVHLFLEVFRSFLVHIQIKSSFYSSPEGGGSAHEAVCYVPRTPEEEEFGHLTSLVGTTSS